MFRTFLDSNSPPQGNSRRGSEVSAAARVSVAKPAEEELQVQGGPRKEGPALSNSFSSLSSWSAVASVHSTTDESNRKKCAQEQRDNSNAAHHTGEPAAGAAVNVVTADGAAPVVVPGIAADDSNSMQIIRSNNMSDGGLTSLFSASAHVDLQRAQKPMLEVARVVAAGSTPTPVTDDACEPSFLRQTTIRRTSQSSLTGESTTVTNISGLDSPEISCLAVSSNACQRSHPGSPSTSGGMLPQNPDGDDDISTDGQNYEFEFIRPEERVASSHGGSKEIISPDGAEENEESGEVSACFGSLHANRMSSGMNGAGVSVANGVSSIASDLQRIVSDCFTAANVKRDEPDIGHSTLALLCTGIAGAFLGFLLGRAVTGGDPHMLRQQLADKKREVERLRLLFDRFLRSSFSVRVPFLM